MPGKRTGPAAVPPACRARYEDDFGLERTLRVLQGQSSPYPAGVLRRMAWALSHDGWAGVRSRTLAINVAHALDRGGTDPADAEALISAYAGRRAEALAVASLYLL